MQSSGKGICLVSGGIDSPVAAWFFIRKGGIPIFIYFDNYPFTGESTKQRALDTIKKLKEYSSERRLKIYVIPHGSDLVDILRKCPRKLTCILCRKMMYRLAESVGKIEGAQAIVTGEIIGEHASQTLRNILVENTAVKDIVILRPVIALDKLDVERLAKNIGTYEVSTKPGLCCSAYPKSPRTHATIEEVTNAEEKLDFDHMIKRDMDNAEILEA